MIEGLPDDLARVLRDPSIVVPQDAAAFEAIARYAESKLRELRHYPDLKMAEVDVHACAYNAAVNHGSGRANKKMWDLVRAINEYERLRNKAKLDELVKRGIIDSYEECPVGCCVRPGGLFHVEGCPNDFNSEWHRALRTKLRAQLPEHDAIHFQPSGLVGHARDRRLDMILPYAQKHDHRDPIGNALTCAEAGCSGEDAV